MASRRFSCVSPSHVASHKQLPLQPGGRTSHTLTPEKVLKIYHALVIEYRRTCAIFFFHHANSSHAPEDESPLCSLLVPTMNFPLRFPLHGLFLVLFLHLLFDRSLVHWLLILSPDNFLLTFPTDFIFRSAASFYCVSIYRYHIQPFDLYLQIILHPDNNCFQ